MARQKSGDEKKEPVQKLRAWTGSSAVEVAVWSNDSGYSVTWHRSYKQGDNWQKTQSLFPQDMLPLAQLLNQAWAWIQEQD